MEKSTAIVIGGGIGGLGTALLLAERGYAVTLLEKNATLGGVCNTFSENGFRFDTGPSWYLWPEAYKRFFAAAGTTVARELDLVRLDPPLRIFDGSGRALTLSCKQKENEMLFESIECGASAGLARYLAKGRVRNELSECFFLNQNYESFFAAFDPRLVAHLGALGLHTTVAKEVERHVTDPLLQAPLLFHAAFLGSSPDRIPALFSFLSSIESDGGVWYPRGGMYQIVEALVRLGKRARVRYRCNAPVGEIVLASNASAKGVKLMDGSFEQADMIVSGADRRHTESLLPGALRTYSETYWSSREQTFSTLLLFLGVRGAIPELLHHNVLFPKTWREQFAAIKEGRFAPKPCVYINKPSATDRSVVPAEHENLLVLVPIAPRIYKTGELEQEGERIIGELEEIVPELGLRIVYKKVKGGLYFAETYNSFGSSALGMAQTFGQSAFFRPNNIHPKLKNLFFVGASTNPGIGVPTCLLSALRVLDRIKSYEKSRKSR